MILSCDSLHWRWGAGAGRDQGRSLHDWVGWLARRVGNEGGLGATEGEESSCWLGYFKGSVCALLEVLRGCEDVPRSAMAVADRVVENIVL